ncbi:spondin domain-containing protein [Cognatitamlana onchidii]|uniref:spondin domain-containing protein n=1 Tax=Cognatitamlana onchidii TaxID=2562860 RepID=UPI0010A682F2|nr:spondin domain-containing protein [Algibacter onchidii]
MKTSLRIISLPILLIGLITQICTAQSTANYNIAVTTIWNADDHGSILDNTLPNDPHWSPLALVTHKNPNEFLQLGAISSQGVQDIAEFGGTTSFKSEVNTAIALDKADQYLQSGFGPRGAISTASINNITVSEDYPLVTLLSMIAPSPDWFIAVNSESLRSGNNNENDGWKSTYSLDMFAYDAGTDDGADYESANSVSVPKVGIFMINSAPINGKKIATVTFTLNSTLSDVETELNANFSLYPSPVNNGKIFVSGVNEYLFKSLEVYSVLGQRVKTISAYSPYQTNTLEIDVSGYETGLYLVKLTYQNGLTTSQKILIQ